MFELTPIEKELRETRQAKKVVITSLESVRVDKDCNEIWGETKRHIYFPIISDNTLKPISLCGRSQPINEDEEVTNWHEFVEEGKLASTIKINRFGFSDLDCQLCRKKKGLMTTSSFSRPINKPVKQLEALIL